MKLKFSTLRNIIIGLLLVILGFVAGNHYRTNSWSVNIDLPFINQPSSTAKPSTNLNGSLQPSADKEVDFDVFWEVWGLLEKEYLEPEELNATEMVNGAVSGMTAAIGDPYTMYLPPTDNKRSGENLSGSFYGVGIELGYVDSTLAVIAPLEGTPAAQAGIQAGDLILHVTDQSKGIDEDTTDWSLEEAVNKIRGEKGAEITFTLYREGENQPLEITVVRDQIVIESVKLEYIQHQGKNIAHLKLIRFGGRTQDEWDQAVASILAQTPPVDGLILDLRNNPGGYFDTSIQLASDFIERGVVVSQKGKYSQEDYRARGEARLRDYPLVVLVNKGSASASEILAGALRDDLGVKLVGQQTFGKGTVQDRRQISNGGGLHITIGRWLLPSGSWIHDEGLEVNVEVKDDRDTEEDEMLQTALEQF